MNLVYLQRGGKHYIWIYIWLTVGVLNFSEFPGIHIEAVQPPVPTPATHIDYSEEAVQYEKKLVQVTAVYLSVVTC